MREITIVTNAVNIALELQGQVGNRVMVTGGFLNQNERIFPAALRELKEETNLDLPPKLIQGSLSKVQVFDHPDRSLRGRTITHAHLFILDGHDLQSGLPKIRAADDAMDAQWIPLNKLCTMSNEIFEDHLSICKSMLGL